MSTAAARPSAKHRNSQPASHSKGHNVKKSAARKPHASRAAAPDKWVYLFSEGDAKMRDLLGGKGADLAEMTRLGLPVPAGFVVTTRACNAYLAAHEQRPAGLWKQMLGALREIEILTGKGFADPANPFLVSSRSDARFSIAWCSATWGRAPGRAS